MANANIEPLYACYRGARRMPPRRLFGSVRGRYAAPNRATGLCCGCDGVGMRRGAFPRHRSHRVTFGMTHECGSNPLLSAVGVHAIAHLGHALCLGTVCATVETV